MGIKMTVLLTVLINLNICSQTDLFNQTLQKAKAGDPIAQNLIGNYYYNGDEGAEVDLKASVFWYKKSAAQGNADGEFNLGYAYFFSDGVEEDEIKAIKWFKSSAIKGNPKAQYWFGYMHNFGRGNLEKSYSQAYNWYLKSANQGNKYAQYRLCILYMTNAVKDLRSKELAFYWCEKSAKQSYSDAQYMLGCLYREGIGTAKNYESALYWGLKSAEKGDSEAQVFVGEMYLFGEISVSDRKEQAFFWYGKAAKQDHKVGQYHFGKLNLEKGKSNEAFYWIKKSYDQQPTNLEVGEVLADLYLNGIGVSKSNEKARKVLSKIGYKKCYSCWGKGGENCKKCDGYGKVGTYEHSARLYKCSAYSCDDGWVRCGDCGGKGLIAP
ncbi:tetratricopeptide repeat protein [Seonamhaeicola marinus]|uniref:Sel1 repeat family protein n=1 Tax=Seonamhaeicola marinus TaxID=1912246 RepID=A0A5D0I584_9FLAO|nr:sel1 repeat family protein [Seonamhaeicola marinus]TYA78528.1 sel1 repeat family protein [Seonamhaeicola marinus]